MKRIASAVPIFGRVVHAFPLYLSLTTKILTLRREELGATPPSQGNDAALRS